MNEFEKVKELIAELEKHDGKRHVYVKKDDFHYHILEVYVDNEGDVILEIEE